jgi:hypothetical protein
MNCFARRKVSSVTGVTEKGRTDRAAMTASALQDAKAAKMAHNNNDSH